jgi:hypothetical protein
MRTDINTCSSDNNIQISISVLCSQDPSSEYEKEVLQLTRTFVADLEELRSKVYSGPTPTEPSQGNGSKSKDTLYFAGMGCNKVDPTLISFSEIEKRDFSELEKRIAGMDEGDKYPKAKESEHVKQMNNWFHRI